MAKMSVSGELFVIFVFHHHILLPSQASPELESGPDALRAFRRVRCFLKKGVSRGVPAVQ